MTALVALFAARMVGASVVTGLTVVIDWASDSAAAALAAASALAAAAAAAASALEEPPEKRSKMLLPLTAVTRLALVRRLAATATMAIPTNPVAMRTGSGGF